MATYIILSRLSESAIADPGDFEALANTVSEKIKQDCPDLK